jgi:hypothetical protein
MRPAARCDVPEWVRVSSGVITSRTPESRPAQAAGVLIVAVGIATACAQMYYEGD